MELTVDQAMARGVALQKAGNLKEAEQIYSAVLEAQPTHPAANHNLGVLFLSAGEASSAIKCFRAAVACSPKVEQFWLSYINALLADHQISEAALVLSAAKKTGVATPRLEAIDEKIRRSDHQSLNAEARSPTSIRQNAPSQKSHNSKVDSEIGRPPELDSQRELEGLLTSYNKGRFDEAANKALALSRKIPSHPAPWKILGAALQSAGRPSEALEAMRRSTTLNPNDAEAHNNLGSILQSLGQFNEAEQSCREAIRLQSNLAEAHNNLGTILNNLGRYGEAEECYRRAMRYKPNSPEIWVNLGNVLKYLGRAEDSQKSYRAAIELDPGHAEAHHYLAMSKTFESHDTQYHEMKALRGHTDLSEEQRCHVNFGLAKADEDLKNYEQAFLHYREANELRKKNLGYEIEQDFELFKKIQEAHEDLLRVALDESAVEQSAVSPIFIVGMPRSGTTLVEQILSSHRSITGGGELPFLRQFGLGLATGDVTPTSKSLARLREAYLGELAKRSRGTSLVTDKMPQNFLMTALIAAAFPEAKIINVKREAAAVCWANYSAYFPSRALGYCYGLRDVVKYYKIYEDLMTFWQRVLGEKVFDLDYELLTEDQAQVSRDLIHYIDLPWDNKCLSPQDNDRPIATMSAPQVRKKVYRGSSRRWKHYEAFIGDAFDDLLTRPG